MHYPAGNRRRGIYVEYVTGYGQPIQRGSVTVIPEPAAVVMLLSGLAGLGVLGWRRRRAA